MAKKWLKKVGVYGGFLLLGVSGYAVLRNVAEKNAPEFNKTMVSVNKQKMSMQDFYNNMSYTSSGWFFIDENGQKHNVDSLCNVDIKDSITHSHYSKIKLQERIDTVYALYKYNNFRHKNDSSIIYKLGAADSLPNLPSMGKYSYNMLVLREFIADNPKLQSVLDIYNDSHNCTKAHEMQHYYNNLAGAHNWNSYSVKFAECCLDEISANIAQCLKQRENFIAHGNDISYITKRFAVYRGMIESGQITPRSGRISRAEQEVIANTVFDAWMKDKFLMYARNNHSRTLYILKDAPYTGVMENLPKHQALMKKFFNIKGYNFWQFISKREAEVFERIPSEYHKTYTVLSKQKYRKMNHFEKMEHLRITEGQSTFTYEVAQNHLKARIIQTLGYREK